MKAHGLELKVKNLPPLDKGFIPIAAFISAYEQSVGRVGGKPLCIALESGGGVVSALETRIHGDGAHLEADRCFVERLVKTCLWMKGGHRIFICGDDAMAKYIQSEYRPGGKRAFDADFMAKVYERPFEVLERAYEQRPRSSEAPIAVGGQLDGYRIGLDAGGSDIKVSAVANGKTVFSEEVVWHPKTSDDINYHFGELVGALKKAAAKLERVDAVGVSSAGIFKDNRCMVASLFLKVPRADFDRYAKDIYLHAVREIADVPVVVCNDGDVTALAGVMDIGENNLLGIAMGTSQAAGYINADGRIMGWLNELAFAPVDLNEHAALDEWSGDIGCGVKYFSQDGVIKLALMGGIGLREASPAERLAEVQALAAAGEPVALQAFESMGVYLAHGLKFYHYLYGMKHVLLLGRVMSGAGGNLMLETARRVLGEEYPELSGALALHLPGESERRVGQSIAAATLPRLLRNR